MSPVLINSDHAFLSLMPIIREAHTIALDIEGSNLSRDGRISLITIGLPHKEQTYLVDVLNAGKKDNLTKLLKEILEDKHINKVVHDCRMDADSLYHNLGITLKNVHDTSVYHRGITGNDFLLNLNEVLEYYGLPVSNLRKEK